MSDQAINFDTFILSLATAGLAALGEIENPMTKQKDRDMQAAKQHIDILELLEKKTKGNLSDSESKLLTAVLYELRIKYVEKPPTQGLNK